MWQQILVFIESKLKFRRRFSPMTMWYRTCFLERLQCKNNLFEVEFLPVLPLMLSSLFPELNLAKKFIKVCHWTFEEF